MKKSSRFLAILLVLATLTLCFAACGGNSQETEPPKDTSAGTTDTGGDSSALNLPEDGFDGEDFNILVSGHTKEGTNAFNDFAYESENPTDVDQAIYKRNMQVENRLSVHITTEEDFKTTPEAKTKVVRNHAASDTLYDAVLPIAYDVSALAYDGKLNDLNSLSPYLNLSNSWWDQKANRDLSINGIMFFTTGDLSLWANEVTACVPFNKTLADDKGIGAANLYKMVKEGTWTYDEMITAAKACHEDLNGNQTPDLGDLYGLVTWDDAIYSVVNSVGVKCCTIDENGKINLTLNSEKTTDIVTKYIEFCSLPDTVINFQYTSAPSHGDAIQQTFGDNKALFLAIMFKNLASFRDADVNYGILPYPKQSAEQSEYYSCVAPWHVTYLCVPVMIEDEDKSGAVLEALCYYSTDTVQPAYYDRTLVGKIFRDDESAEVLDLIFATRIFDVGYYYQPGEINKQLIIELVRKKSTDFASMYASYVDRAQSALDKINLFFDQAIADMGN